jgi:N-hydroxyarylamine O-acetyltransferase
MDAATVEAYLARIGVSGPVTPDAATLATLQRAHLLAVPFENLSIHLGEPITLDPDLLVEKIVERRRGGFCYELNGAFASLLDALGYDVALLAARVITPTGLGPPYDHMCLRVDLDEPWLADVGFGKFATRPLRLSSRDEQQDPGGRFRLVDAPDGDLDVVMDGQPQYRFDLRPRELDEFIATCWYQQTYPTSHFRQAVTCSRLTESGRITISGSRLIVTSGEERRESNLAHDALLAAYREHFGIELHRIPEALGQVLVDQ